MFINILTLESVCLFAYVCKERKAWKNTHQSANSTSDEMELQKGEREGMGKFVNVSFLCFCLTLYCLYF